MAKHPAPGLGKIKGKSSIASKQTVVSFFNILSPLLPEPTRPVAQSITQTAPLAHLDYHEELELKNKALDLFWKHFQLPGTPTPVCGSPKSRRYRTTSKRRTSYRGNTLFLMSGDGTAQNKPFLESPLEPKEHTRTYVFLQKKLSEAPFKLVATHLNYLIIRGNYREQAVIFNVDTMNGPLVRKLKILAGHLQNMKTTTSAAFVYLDPSGSDYYLEERQPANLLLLKKLFGKGNLFVAHDNCKYVYHPTSFSQVNEAMVPLMLDTARRQLEPSADEKLVDLYCGYGLFSHHLAPGYRAVLGVDAEGPSIRSAILNKKHNTGSSNCRFLASRISEKTIDDLKPATGKESILLDPPRKGPAEGVIAALCRRSPQKVLHIFCGVNQIPESVKMWQLGGYEVSQIVPLDMFPGSANLEILILFTPADR